jgi:hypothetical protein
MTAVHFRSSLLSLLDLPPWADHLTFLYKDLSRARDSSEFTKDVVNRDEECEVVEQSEANLVSSLIAEDWNKTEDHLYHYPILDIDFPAYLIPSSHPGRYHLYLARALSKGKYDALLDALAEAGIIERGYAESGKASVYGTAARLPHNIKYEE